MGKTKSETNEATLSEVLASLGWRHEPGHPSAQGRHVFDATNEHVGQLAAHETWKLLRERGLIAVRSAA